MTSISQEPRAALIRRAFTLEWITVAWMMVEAAVAVGSGIVSHSLTLVAFGIDSVIELASAGVLMWRLTVEIKQGREFSEAAEERASKIAGALLFALPLYVVGSALWSFWHRQGAEFSVPGLLVALVAIPTMYSFRRRRFALLTALGAERFVRMPSRRSRAGIFRSSSWSGSSRRHSFMHGGSTA